MKILDESRFAPEVKPVTITHRALTNTEKNKMRRSHFIFIPAILIPGLILFVLYKAESLPTPMRIGGAVIAVAVVLIIWRKQAQLEKDLLADVDVIQGEIVQKIKVGDGPKKGGGGVGVSTSGTRHRSISYILLIGGKRYRVRKQTYKKAIEGAYMEMVLLPKSGYVASINRIGRPLNS